MSNTHLPQVRALTGMMLQTESGQPLVHMQCLDEASQPFTLCVHRDALIDWVNLGLKAMDDLWLLGGRQ